MVKTAKLAEIAIIYGNRYRANEETLDNGLREAERLFYKGDYKKALETSIDSIELVEPGIYNRLLEEAK